MDLAPNLTPVLGRYFQRNWSHGEGHRLWDTDGKAYLDFANGIAVTALGHAHPRVTAAVHAQVDRLMGPINAVGYTEPVSRLATELANTFPDPLDSVFFLNSGAEAIDAALKLTRRVTGRPGIIAFRGGFHGRTFGATSVTTSNLNYRTGYEPLVPGVHFAPYPAAYPAFGGDEDAAASASLAALQVLLETVIAPKQVGSILVEPVLGEGGYVVPPDGFLPALRAVADRHGILLAVDEVQSGYARTGRFFATEWTSATPDIVIMAKGIASGLPLSGILAPRALLDRLAPGSHGGTYGGNAVACAAALATLEVIDDERLADRAEQLGTRMLTALRERAAGHGSVAEVRGRGLMLAIEFAEGDALTPRPDLAKALLAEAMARNVLLLSCGTHGEAVRIIPPLVTTDDEVDLAVAAIGDSLASIGA